MERLITIVFIIAILVFSLLLATGCVVGIYAMVNFIGG